MKPIRIVTAASILTLASSARANIVANGGFETGDFTNWGTTAGGPGTLFGVDPNFGRTGLHSAFFAATSPQDDDIFQILPTTMGLQYTIEFWVHNYGAGEDHFRLSFEGSPVLDMVPLASPLEDWHMFSVNVIASSNGSELRFGGYDIPASWRIDDISVTEVPAPASAAVLIALGVAGSRRRKR